ncbi:MAG: ADP-ribosylglycohydrolase family protein [Parasporobacterium sp.]|nr:ADP-ribosylglycohydrolase family protein [Parasporobacterium sp.]
MYGAILGDMIGSPFEFDRGNKTKEFPLFCDESRFTDDSVMTIAVAEALMKAKGKPDEEVKKELVRSMQDWGHRYPDAGYGGRFYGWLFDSADPKPYNSYGNGSAMRVATAGWLYDTLEDTRKYARLSAEVTHNHPEGIKGAESVAAAIFMARNGASKDEIRGYIVSEFGYDLSRTCDEIRPDYHHVESCQETVPEAITAFLEGSDFEDVIRTAVSLGGDCDTLTCIAGSVAEAFYGVPEDLKTECRNRLSEDMLKVLDLFEDLRINGRPFTDPFLEGNEIIEEAIAAFNMEPKKEKLFGILEAIRNRMHADGHFIIPFRAEEENPESFVLQTLQTKDGKIWQAAFTSKEEFEKGAPSKVLSYFIDNTMKNCMETEAAGIILNPWSQAFMLTEDLMKAIIEADGGVEYSVPDDPITAELLKDGSFLKRATEICNRNRTELNMIKLARILRDSWVWVPCNAIMSQKDQEMYQKMIEEAEGDLESLVGRTVTTQDEVRLVPDILQNGDNFFFPVFTSAEEMGEYGERFSKVEKHFLEAVVLAKNNEKNVAGIVINAFSEPFVISKEMFDIIGNLPSSLDGQNAASEGEEK